MSRIPLSDEHQELDEDFEDEPEFDEVREIPGGLSNEEWKSLIEEDEPSLDDDLYYIDDCFDNPEDDDET